MPGHNPEINDGQTCAEPVRGIELPLHEIAASIHPRELLLRQYGAETLRALERHAAEERLRSLEATDVLLSF